MSTAWPAEAPDRATVALAVGLALALRRSRAAVSGQEEAAGVPLLVRPTDRDEYRALVERVRSMVTATVPAGAQALVISRGDPDLVRLDPVRGRHFPADATGSWAGFHPALGSAASMVEQQRGDADHLVVPATAAWWFQTYPELAEHLASGVCLADDPGTGSVWQLPDPGHRSHPVPTTPAGTAAYRDAVGHLRELVAALVEPGDTVLVISRGDPALVDHAGIDARHFPGSADGTYAGHPADDTNALALLEADRRRGAGWLLIPADAAWWAQHYPGFWARVHLDHPVVVQRDAAGTLIRLEQPS